MFGAYLQPRTASIWSGGLVTALGYFGGSTAAARIALARLVNRGLADRHKEGRLVFYRLTGRCLHILEDGDDRIFSLGQRSDPATTWTIVWHALPDDQRLQRSRLVKQLRFHGFGQLQDGTWVSPRDYVPEVRDLVEKLGIGGSVAIFRAAPDGDLSSGPVISHLWPLDEVTERYRAFIAAYAPLVEPVEQSEHDAFLTCTRMMHEFRSFSGFDPELPERWASHADARREAIAVFDAAFSHLRAPAASHFRALTRT